MKLQLLDYIIFLLILLLFEIFIYPVFIKSNPFAASDSSPFPSVVGSIDAPLMAHWPLSSLKGCD